MIFTPRSIVFLSRTFVFSITFNLFCCREFLVMKVKVVQTLRETYASQITAWAREEIATSSWHISLWRGFIQNACSINATIILDADRHYVHAPINKILDSLLTTLKVPGERIACDVTKKTKPQDTRSPLHFSYWPFMAKCMYIVCRRGSVASRWGRK